MSGTASAKEEMGAYYTKEDVTAYISRSTILPFVLESVAAKVPDFPATLFPLLPADPDRYIPPSVLEQSALPTETERERHHRHERARALHARLQSGEIRTIDDLVTENLDLARLTLDAIAGADTITLTAFWEVLQSITILDPTCGPGAFLFAAIDVLAPLGLALLDAMEQNAAFQSILRRAAESPTPRHFILRNIIENNLFGIDLMDEAVETCRRLFQTSLAESAPPTIHVKAGNALVGYLALPDSNTSPTREDLDRRLAREHGIRSHATAAFEDWRARHRPFHLPLEFPQIAENGGFDIILGNPPYIPQERAEKTYQTRGYETRGAYDIYALVLERTAALLRDGGRSGMIVPLSLTFGRDLATCRRLLFRAYDRSWFSSFGRIPSALFAFDVRVRNTIHLGRKGQSSAPAVFTTRLHRWYGAYRPHLFPTLEYVRVDPARWADRIPKANTTGIAAAFESRLAGTNRRLGAALARRKTPHPLHFKRSAYNWLTFCAEPPPCFDTKGNRVPQTKFSTVHFHDVESRDLALLLLNGELMLAWWFLIGDDFDLTKWMIADFPLDLATIGAEDRAQLLALSAELQSAMARNITYKLNAGKRVGNYNLTKCRAVTDRSDALFRRILGFESIEADLELLLAQGIRTDLSDESALD